MSLLFRNLLFRHPSVWAFIFFLYVQETNAQVNSLNIKFDNLSIKDGLSQSSPNCILQDSRGFLWIGTEDGLNRYDGYTFEVFKPVQGDPYSISSTRILTLYEDANRNLWIGTNGGGLSRYDRLHNRFVQPGAGKDSMLFEGRSVHAILTVDPKLMMVGTESGLFLYKPEEDQLFQDSLLAPLEYMSITALTRDNNSVWIGTDQGLYRYEPGVRKLISYANQDNLQGSPPDERITALAKGRENELWIGMETGVAMLDIRQNRFESQLEMNAMVKASVKAILADKTGKVWVATFGDGLYVYEPDTKTSAHFTYDYNNPYSLSNNEVLSLFCDRSGIIWVGTNGLDKYNPKQEKFTLYDYVPYSKEKLVFRNIHPIYEDGEGVLWVGSKSDGLHWLDRKKKMYQRFTHEQGNSNSLASNHVRAIREFPQGTLWIGTDDMGLTKITLDKSRKPEHFRQFRSDPLKSNSLTSNKIYTIYPDKDGKLWIGTDNGLTVMDTEKEEFTQYKPNSNDPNSLSNPTVYCIYIDSHYNTWLATDNGINRFVASKNGFEHYLHSETDSSTLIHNEILSFMEDYEGNLWIGTYGKGLDKLDFKTNTFIHYRGIRELNTEVIYGILQAEDKKLWLSTNNGILAFDPGTRSVTSYTVNDGLQSNEFNGTSYFMSSSGEMFFGGQYGFNSFYPQRVVKDSVPPVLVLSDLQVRNKSVKPGINAPIDTQISEAREINLSYSENNFTLYFSALHFANPEQNHYKYKLEGFDENWIDAGTRRFVSYTSLPYKTYTFRVIASNSDDIWNETGLSIKIRIRPPFWATIWFRLLLVVSVLGLTTWLIRRRMHFVQQQKQMLEERILENTKDLEANRNELESQKEEIVKQKIELKTREKDHESLLWFNQGLGLFSEIFSKNRNDLNVLCQEFIRNLTTFVDAQQGCIYLSQATQDETFLVLMAHYNLNTEREGIRFAAGESYVGTCFVEKKIIEVHNLTESYAVLHSGLGSQPLTCLFFAPMIADGQCMGVVELGSFHKLKGYRISFIEKILETFSSVIQIERANENYRKFIERSDRRILELTEREEQYRIDLEITKAACEEASRHENELIRMTSEYATQKELLLEEIRLLMEKVSTLSK